MGTSPKNCSTPKSQYSDDSLSQDFSPSVDIDVGWNSKKKPTTRKRRVNASRFAESLAKEKFERNQLWRKPLLKTDDSRPDEVSALERFKQGVKELEKDVVTVSPKATTTNKKSFSKQKENVTRSFTFAGSDDSDDEAFSSWNSLIKKFDNLKEIKQLPATPTKQSEDNWRKSKSAQELNTSHSKVVISEPLKDLFDDSVSDSLLYQCTQQVEKKLASNKSPIKSILHVDNPLDNDSFDEMLSNFPLEEILAKSGEIDKGSKQHSISFTRHNSMPCQSKISSIVQKVNLLNKSTNNGDG